MESGSDQEDDDSGEDGEQGRENQAAKEPFKQALVKLVNDVLSGQLSPEMAVPEEKTELDAEERREGGA